MLAKIRSLLAESIIVAVMLAAGAVPAWAGPAPAPSPATPQVTSLNQVITNITVWIGGLLFGLATLLATIGGVRYLLANGDPAELMKAKETLKYAAIGYGIAILAPVLVTVIKGFVG